MDPGELTELVEFLVSPSPQIRKITAENILGFTVTEEGKSALRNTDIVKNLCKLVETKQDDEVMRAALSSLINLSGDSFYVVSILETNIMNSLVTTAHQDVVEEAILELTTILISNLTHYQKGCMKLLQLENQATSSALFGVNVTKLINSFVFRERGPKDAFSWVSPILMNVTQLPEGRKLILKPSKNIFTLLMPTINDASLRRRLGIIGLVKNCCFEVEAHNYLLSEEVDLLSQLLLPLRGSEKLDDKDQEGMDSKLHNINNLDKQREQIPECRKMILESMLMLTKTRSGRDFMRKKKVYPILREHDKTETDEKNKDLIQELVEILILTDEADIVLPKQPATLIEEI